MIHRIHILSLFLSLVFVTACGSNEATPQPGEYQQSVKITTLDFPGLEGDAKADMIKQMENAGGSVGSKFCMSAEQGEKQWKEAASQMTTLLGGNCETIKDEGSANSLDLELNCSGAPQGDVTVAMTGNAHSQGYESKMSFDIKQPGSGDNASLAMEINAERVGDCSG